MHIVLTILGYLVLAFALFSVALIVVGGCLGQRIAGIKPKHGIDGNYHPDQSEADFLQPGNSTFKRFSREYNIWWNKQPLERLEITAHDGLKLVGYLRRADDPASRRVALVVHGIESVAGEMGFISKMFLALGYHVLAIDLRAHGASEGKYIGFGFYERYDIIRWLDRINQMFDDDCEIVLHGISMGAASVMMTVAERDMADNVVCAIEDCGFSKGDVELYEHLLRDYPRLPYKRAMVWVACTLQQWRAGYSFAQVDCVEAVSRSRVPLLLIHGDIDETVPFWMLDALYEAVSGEKEKLVVPGAKHAVSFLQDEKRYTAAVRNFCNRHFTVNCTSPE